MTKGADTAWIADRLRDPSVALKKQDLAKALGVPPTAVTDILNNRRQIKLSELPALSRMLKLTYEQIIARTTGDTGFQPGDSQVYRTTREVLETLRRQGRTDMSIEEIDDYALLMAELITDPAAGEQSKRDRLLAEALERCSGYARIRGQN